MGFTFEGAPLPVTPPLPPNLTPSNIIPSVLTLRLKILKLIFLGFGFLSRIKNKENNKSLKKAERQKLAVVA